MSVTYGFYNSIPDAESGIGDRRYTAEQFSSIFDGIINDGIYEGYGTAFEVKASSDSTYITVGTGRAWFNHTWTLNNTTLVLQGSDIPDPHDTLNRWDAVVIEVNSNESYRQNSIKIVSGTPATTPKYPTMESTTTLHQYPLAYIYRKYATTAITQSEITNARGTSACPFVTGIISVLAIDSFVAQWQSQFVDWKIDIDTDFSTWRDNQKSSFTTWFTDVKDTLSSDAAGNLYRMIKKLHTVQIITFPASGWSDTAPYTNTVSLEGATGEDGERPKVNLSYEGRSDVTASNADTYEEEYNAINFYKTGENTITATAYQSKPSMDITVSVEGVGTVSDTAGMYENVDEKDY